VAPWLLPLTLQVAYGSLLHREKPYQRPQKAEFFAKFVADLMILLLLHSKEEALASSKRKN
jgi:hypothetical protein